MRIPAVLCGSTQLGPNVEKLLSQMAVNDEFFDASRRFEGAGGKLKYLLDGLAGDLGAVISEAFFPKDFTASAWESRGPV